MRTTRLHFYHSVLLLKFVCAKQFRIGLYLGQFVGVLRASRVDAEGGFHERRFQFEKFVLLINFAERYIRLLCQSFLISLAKK